MTSSTLVLISTSLLSHVCVSLSRQRPNNSSPSAQREQVNPLRILLSESWKGIAVAAVLLIAARPLPPLGVWLVEGKILADSENKSIECLTRIAAPAGFKSEIKHEWTFKNSSRVIDQVTLPEILGNGIDEKPFTTRSRKKAFPIPFAEVVTKEIECSVVLPGGGRIGRVSGLPQSETAIKMP